MNQLQVINRQIVLGKEFKVYGDVEDPLFLAKDVAEWINYGFDSKGNRDVNGMLRTVDEEEKCKNINPINNRVSWFLTEDGLYETLMLSRKPMAKEFKKQVKQILKQLRKGEIQITPTISRKEQLLLQLFSNNPTEVAIAHKKLLEIETKPLLETIEVQKPKVETYDNFIDKEHTLGFRELRKELESTLSIRINENKLKQVLRKKGIIGTTVKATAYGIRNGYAVSKDIETAFGTKVQDRFTMKCREELIKIFSLEFPEF